MKMRWHIGLMTGTVLDGNIDVAFLRTDGKLIEEFGYHNLMPYDEEVKDLLIKLLMKLKFGILMVLSQNLF